jgi:hypothetical protein
MPLNLSSIWQQLGNTVPSAWCSRHQATGQQTRQAHGLPSSLSHAKVAPGCSETNKKVLASLSALLFINLLQMGIILLAENLSNPYTATVYAV